MVKAATMAGNRGTGTKAQPGDEIDYGLPLTHPALMIPIIGLIIMGSVTLIACCCRCLSEGKRSVEKDKDLELRLGRKPRPRRSSEASSVANANANGRRSHDRRTSSFNTADRLGHGQNHGQNQGRGQGAQREWPKSRTIESNGHGHGHLPYPAVPGPGSYGWQLQPQQNSTSANSNPSNSSSTKPSKKKEKVLPYDCYLPPPSYEEIVAVSPREQLV